MACTTCCIFQSLTPVTTYLPSICLIADDLAVIGPPIDDLDLVIYTLNGLAQNFKEFTTSTSSRDTPIDYEIFLQHEDHLQSSAPVKANYANRQK